MSDLMPITPERLLPPPRPHEGGADYGPGAPTTAPPSGFAVLFEALRRHPFIIGSLALLGAAAGLAVGLAQTPTYRATASVALGTPSPQFADLENLMSGLAFTKDSVANEIEILRSRGLARQAAEGLQLQHLPEFNPALQPPSERSLISRAKADLGAWVKDTASSLGLPAASPDPAAAGPAPVRPEIENVVDNFLARLDVTLRGPSQVLDITFVSQEPELAAMAANQVAELYLADRSAVRGAAAAQTSEWYQQRLVTLREDLQRREAEVDRFRQETGLREGSKGSIRAEQLTLLNEQLVQARTQLAQAEARHAAARAGGGGIVLDVFNSVTVQDLRREESQLQAQIAENTKRFGPRHPLMVDLQERLASAQTELRTEVQGIVRSLAAEAAVQSERVRALEEGIAQMEATSQAGSADEAKLRVLEREAEAARKLYEDAVERVEMTAPAAEVASTDGRIISAAVVPAGPDTPPPFLFGLLGLAVGGMGGLAAAFGLELKNQRFTSTDQAEARLRLPAFGVVPVASHLPLAAKNLSPEDQIAARPDGAFAEVISTLRHRLTSGLPAARCQTVLLTSSVKGEGKTMLSIALARSFALSGRRTLLIEGDMRLGRIGPALRRKDSPGLSDYLAGRAELEDIIADDPGTELRFIPRGSRYESVTGLLEPRNLARLHAELKHRFEAIIIDTPPILPVSDAASFVPFADLAVLVIDWRRMQPDIVSAAAGRLRQLVPRAPLGMIMNNIDVRRPTSRDFPELQVYYHGRYRSSGYYSYDSHRAA